MEELSDAIIMQLMCVVCRMSSGDGMVLGYWGNLIYGANCDVGIMLKEMCKKFVGVRQIIHRECFLTCSVGCAFICDIQTWQATR